MLCLAFALLAPAQTSTIPVVNPIATYTNVNGEAIEDPANAQDAPLNGHFEANPSDVGDYTARYEWKIWRDDEPTNILVHRFEEVLDYTFTSTGSYHIQLLATFVLDNDTITYPDETGAPEPFAISIKESKLEFPNAFSPNGDGYNDVLRAKSGYQSIIEFEAAVFNRGGRKLFSWNSPEQGWDGTVGGKTVHDGVYFLVVNAKGADGYKYKIRKTISVLTGYDNEREGTTENE